MSTVSRVVSQLVPVRVTVVDWRGRRKIWSDIGTVPTRPHPIVGL